MKVFQKGKVFFVANLHYIVIDRIAALASYSGSFIIYRFNRLFVNMSYTQAVHTFIHELTARRLVIPTVRQLHTF